MVPKIFLTAIAALLPLSHLPAETAIFSEGTTDTSLLEWMADANYGARPDMDVGYLNASAEARSLVRFDLSSLAGQIGQVNSATLQFTLKSNYGEPNSTRTRIGVFQLRDYNVWSEGDANAGTAPAGSATWNCRSHDVTPWPGAAGATGGQRDYEDRPLGSAGVPSTITASSLLTIPLTGDLSFLKSWADGARNPGFILGDISNSSTARRISIHSSEAANASLRPQLTINYTPFSGETATLDHATGIGDAMVISWAGAGAKNFGARSDMDVGRNGSPSSSFLRFNLGSLTEKMARVSSATLELTIKRDYGKPISTQRNIIGIHRMGYANADWKPGTGQGSTDDDGVSHRRKNEAAKAHWASGEGGADLGGVDYHNPLVSSVALADTGTAGDTVIRFPLGGDITFLKEWADGFVDNAGFIIRELTGDETATRINFHTSEATPASVRPRLTIRYEPYPTAPPTELFVATDGSDSATGSAETPLRTLGEARDRVRSLTSGSYPEGGIRVWFRGGSYPLEGVRFQSPDSGIPGAPVTYAAFPGETVIFDGARPIPLDSFANLSPGDPRFTRVPPISRSQVLAQTITDPTLRSRLGETFAELNWNGTMIQSARFPDQGMNHISNILSTGSNSGGTIASPAGARFTVREAKAMDWDAEFDRIKKAYFIGYPGPDWRRNGSEVADVDNGEVQLVRGDAPRNSNGTSTQSTQRRFFLRNLLSELTSPGEWYFDNTDNTLYLYPPAAITGDTHLDLWDGDGLARLDGARHIHFHNFIIQNVGITADTIFDVKDCDGIEIAGCTIRQTRRDAVNLVGTTANSGIRSCDITDVPQYARIYGRSPSADYLDENRNYAINNILAQVNDQDMFPNIAVNAVGNVIRNNLITGSPVQVCNYRGNDNLFQHNEAYNNGTWEADGGQFYGGAEIWSYGNVFHQNFLHHIIGMRRTISRAGIMPDDGDAGEIAYENIFYKNGRYGFFANQGAGQRADGNLTLEGHQGVGTQAGSGPGNKFNAWRNGTISPLSKDDYVGRTEARIGENGWNRDPWPERFPLFQSIFNQEEARFYPTDSRYTQTAHLEMNSATFYGSPRSKAEVTQSGDVPLPDYGVFENVDTLDLRYKEPRPAETRPVPFEKIGLYRDRFRTHTPAPSTYRWLIRERFKSTPGYAESQGYNPDQMVDRVYYRSGRTIFPTRETSADLPGERLIGLGSPAKLLIPTNGSVDSTWKDASFNDASWEASTASIGYETDTDGLFAPYIGTDTRAAMDNTHPGAYLRIPFTTTNPAQISSLTLRARYDDAIVLYINGTPIASSEFAPASPTFSSTASQSTGDDAAITYRQFDLSPGIALLTAGENTLAVHLMNQATSSSDLLFSPQLFATTRATTPASLFARWLQENSLTGTDALPLADPDSDGRTNLIEYATGSDPTTGSGPSPILATTGTTHTDITFTRRTDAAARALGYTLQTTASLVPGSWTTLSIPPSETTPSPDGHFESLTYRIPQSTGGTRRFFRLGVEFAQ